MTAAALIHDLADAGIRLSRNGDKLRVEGRPGTITQELRLILTEHKTELLAALNDDPIADLRARLLKLADDEGIDPVLVQGLPESELAATAEQVAACDHGDCRNILFAYVRAQADADLRRRGKVPPDETARALCRSCGPVWVHPAVASAAPVVDGLPRLLGCPWCHVQHAGLYVPRPSVSCGECQHFIRDTVNPEGGMGRCNAGCDPARPYPNAKHQCARFTP